MFIAKNNDLITEIASTEEELLKKLVCRVYTSIEETETEYIFYPYSCEFLTQAEIDTKERVRKDAMTLTPADVERALYKAKSMDFDDLIEMIESTSSGIDIKALKIEFKANLFYRGATFKNGRLFDIIGNMLGYTPDDMDYLFENKELPEQNEAIDYSQYTVAQLKAMADERGITYSSNILKADLIALLEGNN